MTKLPHRLVALVALAPLAAVLVGLPAPQDPAADGATVEVDEAEAPVTVIAVRHAEKATDDPRDPLLTPAGEARARDLARLLEAADVTHLFTSPCRRTRATLAPLAEATGLEVVTYDPRQPTQLVARLRGLPPGARAVVSGHSNTTPALVRALGGDPGRVETSRGMQVLPDDAYDRLFVLTLGDERRAPATLELRYGQPTPPTRPASRPSTPPTAR